MSCKRNPLYDGVVSASCPLLKAVLKVRSRMAGWVPDGCTSHLPSWRRGWRRCGSLPLPESRGRALLHISSLGQDQNSEFEVCPYPIEPIMPEKPKCDQNQCLTQGKVGWFKEVLFSQRNTLDIWNYGAITLSENYMPGNWTQLHVFRVDEGRRKSMALSCHWKLQLLFPMVTATGEKLEN